MTRHAHRLAWLLRHGALESKLAMDTGGFAAVDAVLRMVPLTRAELLRVVEENDKSRYELTKDGARIRACQGHSTAGTPVTCDGLEATWARVLDDARVFHGTNVDAARAILDGDGIDPVARTHVHLAASAGAKVGKRAHVDVLLAVDPVLIRAHGLALWRATNGVLLARRVPKDAIVDVTAQSSAGERALAALRAALMRGRA